MREMRHRRLFSPRFGLVRIKPIKPLIPPVPPFPLSEARTAIQRRIAFQRVKVYHAIRQERNTRRRAWRCGVVALTIHVIFFAVFGEWILPKKIELPPWRTHEPISVFPVALPQKPKTKIDVPRQTPEPDSIPIVPEKQKESEKIIEEQDVDEMVFDRPKVEPTPEPKESQPDGVEPEAGLPRRQFKRTRMIWKPERFRQVQSSGRRRSVNSETCRLRTKNSRIRPPDELWVDSPPFCPTLSLSPREVGVLLRLRPSHNLAQAARLKTGSQGVPCKVPQHDLGSHLPSTVQGRVRSSDNTGRNRYGPAVGRWRVQEPNAS